MLPGFLQAVLLGAGRGRGFERVFPAGPGGRGGGCGASVLPWAAVRANGHWGSGAGPPWGAGSRTSETGDKKWLWCSGR